MLFRHLKTGLAIGLTALLFSSGADAAEIRRHVPAVNDDTATTDVDELMDADLQPYRAKMISAQAFGNPNASLNLSLDPATDTSGIPRTIRKRRSVEIALPITPPPGHRESPFQTKGNPQRFKFHTRCSRLLPKTAQKRKGPTEAGPEFLDVGVS